MAGNNGLNQFNVSAFSGIKEIKTKNFKYIFNIFRWEHTVWAVMGLRLLALMA